MRGRISRLFAASMVPVTAGPGLEAPAVRLEPPALEAPAAEPAPPIEPGILTLGAETLTYISTGTELQSPLGAMQLSSNFAAFENYKGYMTLEFVDVVPKFPGYRIASEFLSGASVYRVTNADQYFFDNPTICGGNPLKFIIAKVTSLADVKDGTSAVNLWLLSLDNYMDFGPVTSDLCGGDTYKAAKVQKR